MAVSETMAELLETIDSAQYGRDVREAIHKGIQKCYEDGSAGAEDDTARAAITALTQTVGSIMYPVGSIYMTADSTANPATLFGGTWAAWGSGRVPVGVNTSDSAFDTAEKTGGAKTVTLTSNNLPSHTHTYNAPPSNTADFKLETKHLPSHTHSYSNKTLSTASANVVTGGNVSVVSSISSGSSTTGGTGSNTAHKHSISTSSVASGSAGGSTAVTILQPYITCYMWKRTA